MSSSTKKSAFRQQAATVSQQIREEANNSALSHVLPKLINSNNKIVMKLAKTDSSLAMNRREAHYGIAVAIPNRANVISRSKVNGILAKSAKVSNNNLKSASGRNI